jgi:hypothetical protein
MNRILRSVVLGAAILAVVTTTTGSPVEADTIIYTIPLSEGTDQEFAMAMVILFLTRDGETVIEGHARLNVVVEGLSPDDAVISTQVRQGPVGSGGPVVIDSGVTPANPVLPTNGTVIIDRPNRPVSSVDARALVTNPAAFYYILRTRLNPTVGLRGQLQPLDPFQFGLAFPGLVVAAFTNQATYGPGDSFVASVVFGNFLTARRADIFTGIALSRAESAVLCPTPNDQALRFLGPGGVTSDECRSNLDRPGNRALPLVTNFAIPVQGLRVVPLTDEPLNLSPGQRAFFVCAATPDTVQNGIPTLVRCAIASFTVLGP